MRKDYGHWRGTGLARVHRWRECQAAAGHYGSIKLFRMAYLTSIVRSCKLSFSTMWGRRVWTILTLMYSFCAISWFVAPSATILIDAESAGGLHSCREAGRR